MTTETEITGESLLQSRSIWDEHETWPVSDWKYEIENDDTRLGYWNWVAAQINQNGEGDPG